MSVSRECHPRVSYKSVFPSLTVECLQECHTTLFRKSGFLASLTSVTYNAYKSPMVCTAFKCIEGCGRCFFRAASSVFGEETREGHRF